MRKGADGVWSIQIGPIQPGVYRYTFLVDGVQTTDPRNPASSESLNFVRTMYEVPGAPFLEYRVATESFYFRSQAVASSGCPTAKTGWCQSIWQRLPFRKEVRPSGFALGRKCWTPSGSARGGKEYRWLIHAFERIFGATIFFGSDRVKGTAKVVQCSRFNSLREARIWYNRHSDRRHYPKTLKTR
jgi:hypothetical protein